MSLSDGFALIDKLSWDNFNEGTSLKESVEKYKTRVEYYPQAVLADKIYCTRENRKALKELGIELRPSHWPFDKRGTAKSGKPRGTQSDRR